MVAPAQGAQINAQGVAIRDRGGAVLNLDSDELGIQNIGGALKQVNPDGTTQSIGGAADSSPVWVQQARARSTLLNGGVPFVNGEYFTAFDDGNYSTAVVGTGAAPLSTTAATTLAMTTGANNGGQARVFPIGQPALVTDLTTKPIYAMWILQFGGASAGAQSLVGFSKTDFSAFTAFGIVGTSQQASGSDTNWTTQTFNGASAVEAVSTTAFDTTQSNTIEAYCNGAGLISYYVNQVLIITQAVTAGNYGAVASSIFAQVNLLQPGGRPNVTQNMTRMFARF